MVGRRALLAAAVATGAMAPRTPGAWAAAPNAPDMPQNTGPHPAFAMERWQLGGYAKVAADEGAYAFEVVFSRKRAATQEIVIAHAAVTALRDTRRWQDQRMVQKALGPTGMQTLATGVALDGWSLQHRGTDLELTLAANEFSLQLKFPANQAARMQDAQGLLRKGPLERHTAHGYSLPQLQPSGTLDIQGERKSLTTGSVGWLNHEWSQQGLPPGAIGWDRISINLLDGGALVAYQVRGRGGHIVWDGGIYRSGGTGSGGGVRYPFSRGEVLFRPLRIWTSAVSKSAYPVEWMVRTPADYYTIKALADNQEVDLRPSGADVSWSGLCEVWDSNQHLVGRGRLEMTGYVAAIQL